MSSLKDRKQVGPMTLDAVVSLIEAIAREPEREAELVEGARSSLLANQSLARRRAIMSVLGGGAMGGPATWNDGVLALPDAEDALVHRGPEGSPDHLAFYLPWRGLDKRCGIYFVRAAILETLGRNRGVDVAAFVRTIAVHELFHYHVERLIGHDTLYSGHACSPWCDLEEAGANFVSYRYASASPVSLATFEGLILAKRGPQGGLHGYGDHHLLDERIITAIAHLKTRTQGGCVPPSHYQGAMASLAAEPGLWGAGALSRWTSILESVNSGEIAFYYDMANG